MKFSIIIPTYNRIELLEKAIQSVIKQTYLNFEIIVVNDNPLDKIEIDILIKKYDKVKVIHHLNSKGASSARNTGIINSTGEIIAFLDDDDFWLPEKLTMHLREHQNKPAVGLVYSDCLYVYNNPFIKDLIRSTPLPLNLIESMGKVEFCPSTCSVVSIKRECVEKCGLFDETLVNLEDWDYWFRIAHFFEFSRISKVLAHYNWHLGDRTSHDESKRRTGLNQVCNKWNGKINTPVFKKNLIRSIKYNNSRNSLMAGEKLNAFKKSLKLLNKEVISVKSIRNFIKISLDTIIKRKMG